MSTKLKHCPFCGNTPELWASTAPDKYVRGYSVSCDTCGFELHDEYEDEVVTLWNTRKRSANEVKS